MARKKFMAALDDPTIEAIVEGLFRLENEQQAVALLQRLSQQFVICREQEPVSAGGCPTLKLWIRNFGLNDEEKSKGFRGNYAIIRIFWADGRVSLSAEKIPTELKLHPQKERPKQRHPNWGHPVLRASQKKKNYPTVEEARADLLKLHEEFPETSIPGRDKLHLMVYSRKSNPPIQKITLLLEPQADGTFLIGCKDQQKKPVNIPPKPNAGEGGPSEEDKAAAAGGKFTSLVALQRKKKGKK